jgi:hypothetical protein
MRIFFRRLWVSISSDLPHRPERLSAPRTSQRDYVSHSHDLRSMQAGSCADIFIVPTLCVGMQPSLSAVRDAERPYLGSQAERGNHSKNRCPGSTTCLSFKPHSRIILNNRAQDFKETPIISLDKLHHKGAIGHERNQLIQSFP